MDLALPSGELRMGESACAFAPQCAGPLVIQSSTASSLLLWMSVMKLEAFTCSISRLAGRLAGKADIYTLSTDRHSRTSRSKLYTNARTSDDAPHPRLSLPRSNPPSLSPLSCALVYSPSHSLPLSRTFACPAFPIPFPFHSDSLSLYPPPHRLPAG